MKAMAANPEPSLIHLHGNDVAACIDIIERGNALMKEEHLLKYRDLLQAARLKVYGPTPWEPASVQTHFTDSSSTAPISSSNILGAFDSDTLQSQFFFQGEGLETYMNQVTGYFDNSQLGLDEGLTAWFDTFMNEVQPSQNRVME